MLPVKTKPPLVVIAASDPGPAQALAPVIKLLQKERRVAIKVFAQREALDVWSRHGIFADAVPLEINESYCQELLKKEEASLALCGTSAHRNDLDSQLIIAAKKSNIPTLALVDFWSNYQLRFADNKGEFSGLPDRIAVIDQLAVEQMKSAGFDASRLVITGQPAWDQLARPSQTQSKSLGSEARRIWGLNGKDLVVLFVSQPLSTFYGNRDNALRIMGYDEKDALEILVDCLESLNIPDGKRPVLIIRPHPKEKEEDYAWVQSHKLRIRVSSAPDARQAVLGADLIVGMHSELLIEACMLGCLVVSLQPGLATTDPLPTNQAGYSVPIYGKEDAAAVLGGLLFDPAKRQELQVRLKSMCVKGDSAKRVGALVYDMLGLILGT